ncbi:MAG: FCD domain-containing protein [Burkholderiaceae bacterium]|nr:FCD domain-containing protein [Burkholderiaceae bacterium]
MAFDIEKLQLAPAYRAVSDDLRRRIVDGSLQQGDVLPTETELASRFGVHRSTIREGLRQLEQEGLLRRDGKRLLVSMPRQSDLASTAERALRLRQVSFRDVWEVASALEPLCAALAAAQITDAELEALQRALARTEAVVAAGASPVEADITFLDGVAAATHNQALLLARGPVSLLMHAGYAAIAPKLPQSGARLLDVHRQLLQALQRRDAGTAEAVARRHMQDYRRGCEVAGLDMDQPIPPAR